jgi:hypothetical protein
VIRADFETGRDRFVLDMDAHGAAGSQSLKINRT